MAEVDVLTNQLGAFTCRPHRQQLSGCQDQISIRYRAAIQLGNAHGRNHGATVDLLDLALRDDAAVIYEGEHVDYAHVTTARQILAMVEQMQAD